MIEENRGVIGTAPVSPESWILLLVFFTHHPNRGTFLNLHLSRGNHKHVSMLARSSFDTFLSIRKTQILPSRQKRKLLGIQLLLGLSANEFFLIIFNYLERERERE